MIEVIHAKGHPNITAKHKTTLEITKDNHLTPRGDCIVAIAADKGFAELSDEFKERLRGGCAVEVTIGCGGLFDTIRARGNPNLTFTHPKDIIIRKSDFTCPRTLAINADKAACDIDRELVQKIVDGGDVITKLVIR